MIAFLSSRPCGSGGKFNPYRVAGSGSGSGQRKCFRAYSLGFGVAAGASLLL